MPISVIEFESTPNPNALKCHLDRRVADERRSYASAPASDADPIAAGLFAIEGVVGVMLLDDWLTVLKRPEAAWRPIRTGVARTLREVE